MSDAEKNNEALAPELLALLYAPWPVDYHEPYILLPESYRELVLSRYPQMMDHIVFMKGREYV